MGETPFPDPIIGRWISRKCRWYVCLKRESW